MQLSLLFLTALRIVMRWVPVGRRVPRHSVSSSLPIYSVCTVIRRRLLACRFCTYGLVLFAAIPPLPRWGIPPFEVTKALLFRVISPLPGWGSHALKASRVSVFTVMSPLPWWGIPALKFAKVFLFTVIPLPLLNQWVGYSRLRSYESIAI